MLWTKTKPIRYYFPDIHTARFLLNKGGMEYSQDDRFILDDPRWARGTRDRYGRYHIDSALAAIMYATRKEPRMSDLNTPSECYGWTFDETRDILNALHALSDGNEFYWWLLMYQEQMRGVQLRA